MPTRRRNVLCKRHMLTVPIDPRQEHAKDAVIGELWKNGYIFKSKVGTIAGDSYKFDFDVEMTLDISRIAYGNVPDIIVLVSGDSDFIPIVLDMRGRGIRVEVATFKFAMSKHLTLKSSGFINLNEVIDSDFAEEEFDEQTVEQSDAAESKIFEEEDDNADSIH